MTPWYLIFSERGQVSLSSSSRSLYIGLGEKKERVRGTGCTSFRKDTKHTRFSPPAGTHCDLANPWYLDGPSSVSTHFTDEGEEIFFSFSFFLIFRRFGAFVISWVQQNWSICNRPGQGKTTTGVRE